MSPPLITRRKCRPAPHFCPNLNLSNYIEIGPVDAATWYRFNPPGLKSAYGFAAQLVGGNGLTQAQVVLLDHERLLRERKCHTYGDQTWCFCEK